MRILTALAGSLSRDSRHVPSPGLVYQTPKSSGASPLICFIAGEGRNKFLLRETIFRFLSRRSETRDG